MIGGQADHVLGSPRATYDLALCYQRTPDNLDRLAAALTDLGVKRRGVPAGVPAIPDARAWTVGAFERLDQAASTYRIAGRDLRVIDIHDLITIRQHVSRPKDQSSLVQLLAINRCRAEDGRGEPPPLSRPRES